MEGGCTVAVRKSLAIHVATILLLPSAAHAWPTNLYSFGDSLLDSGNAYAITESPDPLSSYPISPPYAERFSNGHVASEVLAADLGVTADPSQLGGTDYATGGATSGFANFAGAVFGSLTLPPPVDALPDQIALLSLSDTAGLMQQIGLFTAVPPPDIGSSLILIWSGSNDLFLTSALVANMTLPAELETFIQAADGAAANVEAAITSLIDAGTKNILAVNLPDLGQTPAGTDPSNLLSPFWSAYTYEFNAQFLDPGYISGLDPSVRLIEFDMFSLFNQVLGNPGKYGFLNVTDACLPTEGPVPVGLPCAMPDQYLFWDSVHPSAAAHQIIGELFYMAVPEPPTLALLIAPIALLLLCRRPRHAVNARF
jgi:phospholipase/lecithinase/hemolysin